ncbi:MAG: 2-(1,2-epoxy-1,2-dihydrophenyl)acetyl-CoA isomerase [Acidobacteria bacterium]|nr:MAG: 2-(1,2-epoxy-1,2-dihydrophenyl)acetyl-CoA isomerase [Acidobacteriota bacterium]
MSVDYQLDGDVAVITFNRPDRFNAIEAGLATGTVDALDQAGGEARAVVLTGKGKAFCSGADLSQLMGDYESGGPDLASLLNDVFHPMVNALANSKVPTVAAVNGVAAGAGLGIALGCDIRIMAESAFLTSAFTAIGLVPDSGTTWWLAQHVGVSKAIELTMTNKRVNAEEARSLGLCAEVVPDGEVVVRAVELATTLADMVPDALVTTRRLVRDAVELSFGEALEAERREQGRLGKTAEHREGVAAFLEKRKPDFRNAG